MTPTHFQYCRYETDGAVLTITLNRPQALNAVLSLQNGVGHEDVLASLVGKTRVLAGKTYVGGVLLAPGHWRAFGHHPAQLRQPVPGARS